MGKGVGTLNKHNTQCMQICWDFFSKLGPKLCFSTHLAQKDLLHDRVKILIGLRHFSVYTYSTHTSDMNQQVSWPSSRASCDSLSASGIPICARSHNSDRHSSSLYLAELRSNSIT